MRKYNIDDLSGLRSRRDDTIWLFLLGAIDASFLSQTGTWILERKLA